GQGSDRDDLLDDGGMADAPLPVAAVVAVVVLLVVANAHPLEVRRVVVRPVAVEMGALETALVLTGPDTPPVRDGLLGPVHEPGMSSVDQGIRLDPRGGHTRAAD